MSVFTAWEEPALHHPDEVTSPCGHAVGRRVMVNIRFASDTDPHPWCRTVCKACHPASQARFCSALSYWIRLWGEPGYSERWSTLPVAALELEARALLAELSQEAPA